MKHGIFLEGRRHFVYVNGQLVNRCNSIERAQYFFAEKTGSSATAPSSQGSDEPAAPQFHINERFDFLHRAVVMVAAGIQAAAVITGSGGLGKSYAVRRALESTGLRETIESETTKKAFITVKGYSTPKGLYRTLFENNDSVIVFDDCDSILKDPVALNILKGALDSYDTRVISWNADMRDDDLPRSFIFTGRVIFISNLAEEKIDQAIRSRAMTIDVSMTRKEIVERMEKMIGEDNFMPQFDQSTKLDALMFINDNTKIRNLSLRTLMTVCKVRASGSKDWKKMSEYLCCKA